jgi:hypothetical protein
MAGSCGQSSYSRVLLTGGAFDAEMGNLTGLGDGSVDGDLGTGGGGVGVSATGGAGAPPSTGGAPGSPGSGGFEFGSGGFEFGSGGFQFGSGGFGFGSGGFGFGSGGTGGASQTASGGSGPRASGGSGSGGAHSGGATTVPPATGGAPGSGGLGTGGATVVHTGGAMGSGGAPGTGGAIASPDPTRYNFESSSQGWGMAAGGDPFSSVGRSTAQRFSGSASLAGTVSAASGKTYILEVSPPVPAIPAGASVTFHVYVPAAAQLSSVQPYVLNDVFKFIGVNTGAASLKRDGWTTIVLPVPASETNVIRLGVQFASSGAWTGTVYLDSIDW